MQASWGCQAGRVTAQKCPGTVSVLEGTAPPILENGPSQHLIAVVAEPPSAARPAAARFAKPVSGAAA